MAFAEPTRYGTAQRPQYQYQQPSYASSQQPYAAEFDYAPEQPNFNDRPPQRPHPDAYGRNGQGLRHDHDRWQGTNGDYNGRGEHYGGRGRNGGGGPPQQRTWQQPVEGRGYNGPNPRGQPRSKSRPPERHRNQGPDPNYQFDGFQERQPYQQQYPNEPRFEDGSSWKRNDGYGHDEYTNGSNGWNGNRHYGSSEIHEHGQYNSRNDTAGWENGNSSNPQTIAASNHPSNSRGPQQREPPPSSHGHSSKSDASQRSKASSKRIIDNPISPETVAWDNPFPTFPMRPKKWTHSSSKSLDGPAAESDHGRKHQRDKSDDNRPQTASSKSSSYTIPQEPTIDESNHYSQNRPTGAFNPNAPVSSNVDMNQSGGYGRSRGRDNDYPRNQGNLKPPAVATRHSEDNRTRPSIPTDRNLQYERSNTMPAAISEAPVRPSNQSRPAVQTAWQEPGPVAGYYGPEDRGYTPTNASYDRSFRPVRENSNEKRPYGHAAFQNQAVNARPTHTPQDSLNEVFDNYYDGSPQHERPPYQGPDHRQHRTVSDEEMPNFDAAPDSGGSHRRGLTIDKHLQPQRTNQELPPVPSQREYDHRNDHRVHPDGPVPRSRSQPNLKDRRSPRPQHDNGFDFGVPGPPVGPPSSATESRGYHFDDNLPSRFQPPGDYSSNRQQHPRQETDPEMLQDPGRRRNDWRAPPSRSGPPPSDYRERGPPGGFRSPPQDERGYRPPPLVAQNSDPSHQFRPMPPKAGSSQQGLSRPPGARPSPTDRNMGGAPPNSTRQPNERPPGTSEPRSRDGRPQPLDDRSLRPMGPGSPPPKSPLNPDALPAHPAPIRAGLMEGSPVNQAAKPAPVRQYNATPSPMQLSNPSQTPGSSQANEGKRDSAPVTHQELDRLKQAIARNPNDMATQLVLAKKLAEAASILVDERADSRTRAKSREKYNSEALKIVKKLLGSGYIEATFYLADCYTRGSLGLESDTREAFKLYQNAAKAGHAQAAYRVAVCCEIGQEEGGGTSRDPVKAMQWYKRAATLGDTPAMYKMGIISLKGLLGQPRNPREAITWLKRAAERADKENPHALHELALLHEKPSGNEGVQKDEAYSKQLFTQAANLGYKFSQHRLGCAYEYNLLGCPVDPRQSIAWYSKAAVQEEHQSELALSGWYLTGSDGILQQSDTEAYLWARKAAQAGLAKAEYAMGYFTEVGIGSPANLEDAKRWYWRAASQNFPKARDRLEELRKGGPTKRKERVSRSNIRKSTEGECVVM